MSDMEKAQILHNLNNAFDVDVDTFQMLLNQIKDPKYLNNYDRITKGLKVEDNYKMIFSALPWVKNINGIHQEQVKRHRSEYQPPDYSLLVENSQKENFPLFIDVKSVKDQKQTCKLIPKQIATLMNYSVDHKTNILLAIYWEKYRFWTHNCLSSFEGEKKNKISFENALKNDLSHVLSDYTFIINKPFYRKTHFSKYDGNDGARHEKFGKISKIYIGSELNKLEEFSIIESAIIDSIFDMKQIEVTKEEETTIQTECYDSVMFIKLSNWLTNYLNTCGFECSEKINDILITEHARIHIVELAKYLGFTSSYLIPDKKNKCTEKIFRLAYENTFVMTDYLSS